MNKTTATVEKSEKSAVAPTGVNTVSVLGELYDAPRERELAGGTRAASFSLMVRHGRGAAVSVPMVWRNPPTRITSWKPGERVAAYGSIGRRFFRAEGRTISVIEVSVERAELERHKARFNKLVAAAPDPGAQLAGEDD